MNKRALMLTAATAALLSGQAYGANTNCAGSSTSSTLCDVTTSLTAPVATASVNTLSSNSGITIDTNGSIVITTNPPTAPAVTINSGSNAAPAIVTVNSGTNITYTGVNYTVGTLLEEAAVPSSATGYGAAESWTGEFINSGTVNLTGTGTNKVGILIAGGAFAGSSGSTTNATIGDYGRTTSAAGAGLGAFTGVVPSGGGNPIAIDLAAGSVLEVQGTSSYGINLIAPSYTSGTPSGGATLVGDIDIAGSLTLTPTTAGSTSNSGNIAVNIAGWMPTSAQPNNPALSGSQPYAMVGNLNIGSSGVTTGIVTSEGEGAQGIVVLGAMNGGIANYGTVETLGTTTPSTSTTANDPEAGSALVIANTVTGGIYNAGPTASSGTGAATFSTRGTAPTIYISSVSQTFVSGAAEGNALQAVPIVIGKVASDTVLANQFSLLNRGSITALPEDANNSSIAISILGTSADTVTLSGGIYTSGAISAGGATASGSGTAVSATAISIGDYTTVGTGTDSHYAVTAAFINSNQTGGGSILANVTGSRAATATAISIGTTVGSSSSTSVPSLFNSGSIAAAATTTDTTISSLNAYAIYDNSGSLTTITNRGTISAIATALDNEKQQAIAVFLGYNTTGATITNNGTIVGDIVFGDGNNTLNDIGTNTQSASITGNISFAGHSATGNALTIGSYASVTGEISNLIGNQVNVQVQTGGTLDLLTVSATNSNAVTAVTAGKPLYASSFDVAPGATLDISASQGFADTNSFASPGGIVQAQTEATISDNSSVNISFGSYVTATSSAPAHFILISAPTGHLTISGATLASIEHNLTVPYLFTGNVSEKTNVSGLDELVLTLGPKSIGTGTDQIPLTGYAARMFKYANEALSNDNALGAAMVTDVKNSDEAQAAYAAYAPDVSGATRATAISLTDSATNIVAARQRELRMYAAQEGDTTLWGQQFAERLSQGNTSSLTGYNDNGFGFAFGMDEGDPRDGRYGAAFTFFTGGVSQKEPTSAKTSSEYYVLTGYTDWRGKGLFLDTQASVGYGRLRGRRYLTLGSGTGETQREADGNRATELLSGGVTFGGIFNAGGTVITPQLSIDGLTMREESYSETNGGSGFDLRVRPYYANSLRAFLGADIRQDVNFGDFYLQPELRFGYRYDFVNGSVKLRANFASVGATGSGQSLDTFVVQGPDPGHGNLVLGGGLATTTGSWSIGVNYDYVKGNNGPSEQSGVVTLIGRI